MKKKILIITNEFIPYTLSLGGIVRVLSLSNFLINKNIEVYILTSKNNFQGYFGYEDLVSNIKIHYIDDAKPSLKTFIIESIFVPIKILKRIFPKSFNLLVFFGIDQAYFKIKKYQIISDKLIKDNNINNLLISSPPFSLFFISSYLRSRNPKLNIIHDYRDSWVLRFDYKNNFLQKFIYTKIEHKTMINCDHILCATETIKRKIEKNLESYIYKIGGRLSATDINIMTLMNGYHHQNNENIFNEEIIKLSKDKSTINIGYFGIIDDNSNSYRDVGVIYNEMIKNPNIFKKIIFHFYGPSTIKNKKILNHKNFKFNAPVDHVKALNKMLQMDYLLIVHTEEITASEVLTGKLFDYIYVGKTIIVISRGETEAGKLITDNNVGININLLKTSLSGTLKSLIKKPLIVDRNENLINTFSRNNQNKKILKILF